MKKYLMNCYQRAPVSLDMKQFASHKDLCKYTSTQTQILTTLRHTLTALATCTYPVRKRGFSAWRLGSDRNGYPLPLVIPKLTEP